jgi:heme-degrading monooxygenase HmoA
MILFQLLFEVAEDKRAEFERTYAEVFEPALRRQPGFQNVKFLRLYPPAEVAKIEAAPTEMNYQINFVFDSEQQRRAWAKTAEHDVAWPKLVALAAQALWRGYDVLSTAVRPQTA